MSIVLKGLEAQPGYRLLERAIRERQLPAAVTGLSQIHKALFIHALCEDGGKPGARRGRKTVVLTADEAEANRMVEDLRALGTNALVYPARELSLRRVETASREYEQQRLGVLAHVAEGDYDCVLACVDAALQRTLPPDSLLEHTLELVAGKPLPVADLAAELVRAGYERCGQIEGPGQFAVRGGIFDVYPAAWTARCWPSCCTKRA